MALPANGSAELKRVGRKQKWRSTVAVGTAVERTRTKQLNTPSGRFYQVDDETYPSVTHILSCIGKPALINWAANTERTLVS